MCIRDRCYAETEDSDEAVRYLNMVRERAGTTAYVFKNKDALLEEIQKERGRELLGEFQRKFDLVRWGIWYQMTYEYTNYPCLLYTSCGWPFRNSLR